MEVAKHITIDPKVQGGHAVITGTRMPVEIIVGSLAGGMTIGEVSEQYGVTEEQIRAALAYAERSEQPAPLA
jgi:uncharacterized protein (DUF433 family)